MFALMEDVHWVVDGGDKKETSNNEFQTDSHSGLGTVEVPFSSDSFSECGVKNSSELCIIGLI